MFNPIASILTQLRHAVIDQDAPTAGTAIGGIELLAVPVLISSPCFVLGWWVFMREAPRIAENLCSRGPGDRQTRPRRCDGASTRSSASARASGARQRGAGGGPGPHLLARPLEPRPQRAHAPPRRERASRRAARGARGLPRALRLAPAPARASCASGAARSGRWRNARTPRQRPPARFARSALARPAHRRAGDRAPLRATRAERHGRRRGGARAGRGGALGDGRRRRPASA